MQALVDRWAEGRRGVEVDLVGPDLDASWIEAVRAAGALVRVRADTGAGAVPEVALVSAALTGGTDLDVVVVALDGGVGDDGGAGDEGGARGDDEPWHDPLLVKGILGAHLVDVLALTAWAAGRLREQGHGAIVVDVPEVAAGPASLHHLARDTLVEFLAHLGATTRQWGVHVLVAGHETALSDDARARTIDEGLSSGVTEIGRSTTGDKVTTALRGLPGPLLRRLPGRG